MESSSNHVSERFEANHGHAHEIHHRNTTLLLNGYPKLFEVDFELGSHGGGDEHGDNVDSEILEHYSTVWNSLTNNPHRFLPLHPQPFSLICLCSRKFCNLAWHLARNA